MRALVALMLAAQPFPTSMTARQGTTPWIINGSVSIADGGFPLNINPPASLPLPTGASTDGTLSQLLDGGLAELATIAANQANQRVVVANLPAAPARNALTGAALVDGSRATQPVSAAALPLPAGAAQENGNLAAILQALLVAGPVNVVAMPGRNPFLQPCNAVRRTNCQP